MSHTIHNDSISPSNSSALNRQSARTDIAQNPSWVQRTTNSLRDPTTARTANPKVIPSLTFPLPERRQKFPNCGNPSNEAVQAFPSNTYTAREDSPLSPPPTHNHYNNPYLSHESLTTSYTSGRGAITSSHPSQSTTAAAPFSEIDNTIMAQQDEFPPTSQELDWEALSGQFLNMHNQEPADLSEEVDPILESLQSAAGFSQPISGAPSSHDMHYRNIPDTPPSASPCLDSPPDEMLHTPIMDDYNYMTGPVVASHEDFGYSLFGGLDLYQKPIEATPAPPTSAPPQPTPPVDFESLYTMEGSPETPTLDSEMPFLESDRGTRSSSRRSMSNTRKVTPDALIPLDAPTQPRTYRTPSSTSRKELPIAFARKRARSQAFGDEDDDEDCEIKPSMTEAEAIIAKRRQNTIAARRSRQKKAMYVQDLEQQVDELTKERDSWKSRALTNEAVLRHHGLAIPRHADV